MHGYAAACIVPEGCSLESSEIITQPDMKYAAITIKDPFKSPFTLIPDAYKTLMRYMDVNNIGHNQSNKIIPCFEKEYSKDDISYMDIYIAVK